jgi:hypothetical protein
MNCQFCNVVLSLFKKNGILLLFVWMLGASACQKVVDIDLNTANPKLVVEANLEDHLNTCSVVLTKSVNFNESNVFPSEQGALVLLTKQNGEVDTLKEAMAGVYNKSDIRVCRDSSYTLSIKTKDGSVYQSQSMLRNPIVIDTMFVREEQLGFRGKRYYVHVKFKDDGAMANYYKVMVYLNGVKSSNIRVRTDELFNGKMADLNIRMDNSKDINPGDQISINIQGVDKGVYTYFFGFNQLGSGPNASATPANPISNIEGGCLGYFSANANAMKTVIVP